MSLMEPGEELVSAAGALLAAAEAAYASSAPVAFNTRVEEVVRTRWVFEIALTNKLASPKDPARAQLVEASFAAVKSQPPAWMGPVVDRLIKSLAQRPRLLLRPANST